MDEAWETFKGYFVCLNCASIVVSIFKLVGFIGDEIPWWVACGPLIIDIFLILIIMMGMIFLMCYGTMYDSMRKKKTHKNSQKKPLLK